MNDMKILNIGCGTKTSDSENVINIDWSIYLRIWQNPILRLFAKFIFNGYRYEKYRSLPDNIRVVNVKNGLPFEDESIDVVYHSHLLEHIDRDKVIDFLNEVKRVLKPGGIQRIVIPDLEQLCRSYLSNLDLCLHDREQWGTHETYIEAIFEQMVRKEGFGSKSQKGIRRAMEKLILGDAQKRGETHRWMYDRVNLGNLLNETGFKNVMTQSFQSSNINNWATYGLDVDGMGREYKPSSLYIECQT